MLLLLLNWYVLLHMISQITTKSMYHTILITYSAHDQFVFSLSLKSPAPQMILRILGGRLYGDKVFGVI